MSYNKERLRLAMTRREPRVLSGSGSNIETHNKTTCTCM